MKHGLCADHLACAFVDCKWTNDAKNILQMSNLSTVSYDSIKDQLPTSNLPAVITFPRNVKELVSAMHAAKKHDTGLISVKTSGHSYPGSSTMRTSTQINLRGMTNYSSNGIKECNEASTGACILARARGKKAIIRVGGGEIHDNTYRAVLDWNENNKHSNKYAIVGGGAGTVAAAGGWLQGGGLSTGLERHYGPDPGDRNGSCGYKMGIKSEFHLSSHQVCDRALQLKRGGQGIEVEVEGMSEIKKYSVQ
jgi:hypothetical protein